jgi:phosphoenolpyruvate synthase/pyruvate phosphate dikinase
VFPGSRRVRFRSSTNAEDLPGFNGAGLYRSVVVPIDGTDAQLADGLRSVWSSVWSFPGYEERAYFRIDPRRVAMGVLVQESIDDDVVDGVAITANPFNEGRPGLFVNVQVAGDEGGAVTSARGDAVPEQILYYTYGGEREFERLSRSSLTHGAPVLSDEEIYQLSFALRAIHLHFIPLGDESHRAMDVEFILAGPSRRVVFVQARPYTVRYDEGRTMATRPGE